jgi:hypothetical protein
MRELDSPKGAKRSSDGFSTTSLGRFCQGKMPGEPESRPMGSTFPRSLPINGMSTSLVDIVKYFTNPQTYDITIQVSGQG